MNECRRRQSCARDFLTTSLLYSPEDALIRALLVGSATPWGFSQDLGFFEATLGYGLFLSEDLGFYRNRKLQTSKAPLKSQAQGTSLFTSAASHQRGFPKNSPWEAQVRLPEGERRQIRR